jgi:N-acetyl-gamma-glutamyl-phosphate reductase
LSKAHYGLPELFGAPPEGTKLVANPGCYPTATLLALGPLVREGLVEAEGIVVDAKSGVTGAGRQAKEEYSFCEVDEDLRAYKLLSHQHTPEIQGALSQFCPSRVTFTAHLLPLRRGLLATCYARPKAGVTTKQAMDCLRDTYLEHFMISVVAPEEAKIKGVAGTNLAKVGVTVGEDVVIAVGAIDNLVKGAAGQAIQNLNLLYDLPSTEGLDSLHRYSP